MTAPQLQGICLANAAATMVNPDESVLAIDVDPSLSSSRAAARPLRIAMMIETEGLGGAEMMALRLAGELARRGHSLHFVGPDSGQGWLPGEFRKLGAGTSSVKFRRTLDVSAYRTLSGILARVQPDVIHSHQFAFAVYGAAVARRRRIPHIITLHGNPGLTSAWRRRAALRWARRCSAAMVAVSEATRREFTEALGRNGPPLEMIPNGVPAPDTRSDALKAEFGLGTEPLLVAVGNLLPVKGHIVLLRALDLLGDRPWRLAILGSHESAAAGLQEFVAARGWGERVLLPGVRHDVGAFLGVASVFVMPSLWEGLPLALLEAMRVGLPIVASDVAGIPEVIQDGVQGLLVPPSDPEALARALERVLDDAGLRGRLGAGARARGEEYSIETMTDRYLTLYQSAGAA